MAEEDSTSHPSQQKLSKFLRKSKWGNKIFKEDSNNDSSSTTGPTNLDQDVADFLKPSTEKHALNVPKLDIALAKRWPEAHEVRQLGPTSEYNGTSSPLPSSTTANVYTKPKRRKGLTVGFVKTLPEIIGEGGDEAPDPPLEISRHKAKVSRSASDRRAGSLSEPYAQVRSPPLPEFGGQQDGGPGQYRMQYGQPQQSTARAPPPRMQDMGNAPPIRRMQTSGNEFSPAMQRRIVSPTFEDIVPHKPSIGRTPTGFSSPGIGDITSETVPDLPQQPPPRPMIDTQFGAIPQRQEQDSAQSYANTPASGLAVQKKYPGLEPALADPASPVDVKRREMRASEGQALRRASMMVPDDLDEDEEDDGRTGQRASHTSSVARSTSDAASSVHPGFERVARDYAQSPEEVPTPDDPGPFADPKYISQHPGDRAAASNAFTHRPHPSLSQVPPTMPSHQRDGSAQSGAFDMPQRTVPNFSGRAPQVAPPRDRTVSSGSSQENYGRPLQPEASPPFTRQAPPQSGYQPYNAAQEPSLHSAKSSRSYDPSWQPPVFARANGSSASINRLPPPSMHSHSTSRDSLHLPPDLPAQPPSPYRHHQAPSLGHDLRGKSSQGSLLGPGRAPASPMSHARYEDPQLSHRNVRSPIAALRETERPSSSGSHASSILRGPASPSTINEGDPAAESAYVDFAARVAHMKGVFRLTAERELPAERCTSAMWLRAALWWYLQGKTGLEYLLRQHDRRGLLTQAHVDLGKAWWILVDRLEVHATLGDPDLDRAVSALRNHFKSLSLAMGRNAILPPEQSLIQGQDTRIWLEYPRFTMDAAAVLGGSTSTSMILDERKEVVNPYDLLPLGDSREFFCYGRFPVEVSLNTDEQETDRVVLPCMLTVLRNRSDYQTHLAIASQTDLVSIQILPELDGKRHLSWADVAWKSAAATLSIRLPRGFDLTVRMAERDFRAVWNLTDYARKIDHSLRAEPDEVLIHEARLAELQYADSANPHVFPAEKLKGCLAMVYEKSVPLADGNGLRRLHRGYRLLLITETGHKTLSAVSHELGRRAMMCFEFLTDSAAGGTTAMVLRIREEQRQCRVLLVFPDAATRADLHAALTGMKLADGEAVVAKTPLASLAIESAESGAETSHFSPSALQGLQWHSLSIINSLPDPSDRHAATSTVESDHLRLNAVHATGSFTNRLNLGKGELLLRFPPSTPSSPSGTTLQILRPPQSDATLATDVRLTPPVVVESLSSTWGLLTTQPTVRTFTFPTSGDLHLFHAAITGYAILFDGVASSFAISRRRMVVPIYKKLEAQNVRVVVVSKVGGGSGGVASDVKVLVFMEEFAACEALSVRVRESDGVEKVKSGKGGGVRLVDAKFRLVPPPATKGSVGGDKRSSKNAGEGQDFAGGDGVIGGLEGRFVNLEGLEYAEEHDDLTVGFGDEADRDAFAQALPAMATSVSRGITMRRRI